MADRGIKKTITLSVENYQLMEEFAKVTNLTVTQFMAMACVAGAKQVMRVLSPEKMLTPKEWAEVLKAAGSSFEGIEEIVKDAGEK